MKEISDLYCRKCKIRENSNINYRTVAYKIGKAKDASKRDTKSEFSALQNANPKSHDGLSKVEVDIGRDLEISGPTFFIDRLEDFIIHNYFNNDQVYFDTKHEYFSSYHETSKKYDRLIEVLKTKESEIVKYNDAYKELTDKQILLLSLHTDSYNKLLEDIKSTLDKFLTPLPMINAKPVTKISTPKPSNDIDIYSILTSDFILLKGQGKYMLMHKQHHKGKDPLDPKGSWKVDSNLGKSPKFQFHNTDLNKKYGYKQTGIGAKKAIQMFDSSVLDYDDPKFDKSKLP